MHSQNAIFQILFRAKTRIITLMVIITFAPFVSYAQDILYKTDNTIIEAIVLKISVSEVEFKRFSNQSGPVYTLPKEKIRLIIYSNGEKEDFSTLKTVPEISIQKNIPGTNSYGIISHDNARALLLAENFTGAVSVYAQIIERDPENAVLNAEYAYALALCGIYDAALSRLDRIQSQSAKNADYRFFAAQVYDLMAFPELSSSVLNEPVKSGNPMWISPKTASFSQKYGRKSTKTEKPTRNEMVTRFKLGNGYAAQNLIYQSLNIFEEITQQFPDEYLPFVSYSIVLEKSGLLKRSSQALETAISKTSNTPEMEETRHFLNQRLSTLNKKLQQPSQIINENTEINSGFKDKGPRAMLYAGGMFSSGYSSFNTRAGYFLKQSMNIAFDLGVINSNKATNLNLGASVYQRYKFLVFGTGINGNFGKDYKALYFKLSFGPSIMNRKKTASLDIFYDINASPNKENPAMFGFSIGRSLYFGKRKQIK